jgi:hypothetical protein
VRVSEDQVFDLLMELVDYSAERGLPRTASALEGVLDAFLQDRGLMSQALPAPDDGAAAAPGPLPGLPPRDWAGTAAGLPDASAAALERATAGPVLDALRAGDGTDAPGTAAPAMEFHSRRATQVPRRLHLMPSQRVAV